MYISLLGSLAVLLAATDRARAQGLNASSAAAVEKDPGLLWSTYAPQLYFGVRPRLPKSLSNGLMWLGLNDWEGIQRLHHDASSSTPQEGGLQSYTYTSHLPRIGNTQTLIDSRNGFYVNTGFVNLQEGAEWGARVEMNAVKEGLKASGLWYVALEGEGTLRLVEQEGMENGLTGPIVLLGEAPDLGPFRITLTDHENSIWAAPPLKAEHFEDSVGKTSWVGLKVKGEDVWKAKELVQTVLSRTAQAISTKFAKSQPPRAEDLPDPSYVLGMSLGNSHQGTFDSNFWAFQKSWDTKGGWDVLFERGDFSQVEMEGVLEEEGKRSIINDALKNLKTSYEDHFDSSLPLPSDLSTIAHRKFAQEVTSNLLGGVGYFSGRSLIDRSFAHEYDETPDFEPGEEGPRETEKMELLTATPSRSFFPRGFYWDEGFHLLVVGSLDSDLSLEILKSWVDLIDEDGWVGREQILGEEARSKVPAEFRVQVPTFANPPTLSMAATAFITRLKALEAEDQLSAQLGLPQTAFTSASTSNLNGSKYLSSPEAARSYLLSIYPALRRHYHWFRTSQKGQLKQWGRKPPSRLEAYRWRGRTEKHVLTSGLDDYPRAVPPSVGELHVDLMCWMGFFGRAMGEIADYLGEEYEQDLEEYTRNQQNIFANLEALHWSEEDKMYCDVTVDDEDESIFACNAGYISLFPLLTGVLPPSSPHLGPILDLIHNPARLWSPYGIRSLAKDHPLFGKDENYWRGPIWMPFNYMVLSALYKTYIPTPGPFQEQATVIYNELRDNLIKNIFKEYQRTGYVWEQYDSISGEGSRSHPFTGWTSLIALIMAEKY